MNILKITESYFHFFKTKNIEELKSLFSKDIILKDWEVEERGFLNVVKKNIEILNNLGNFDLSVNEISADYEKNITFAEILIKLSDDEEINVLDKISFDSNHKIKSITAFKG
tara:strand:+ start:1315 stop:1650 length:336 start_codon:yes stop_codon:yes gene_type:complete